MFDSTPFIVISFILLNVLVYLIPLLTGKNSYAYKTEMAVNADTLRNKDFMRLITSQFTHWDILHLGVNMYSLFNVGGLTISVLSLILKSVPAATIGFVFLYLISGVLGAIFSIKFSRTLSAGASGAIFGLIGFITAFAIVTNQTALLQNLLIFGLINIGLGLLPGMDVDNYAHGGGFLSGLAIGFALLFSAQLFF